MIHRAVDDLDCDIDCPSVYVGTSDVPADSAFSEELEPADWRLDVQDGDDHACLTVPPTVEAPAVIVQGRC